MNKAFLSNTDRQFLMANHLDYSEIKIQPKQYTEAEKQSFWNTYFPEIK